MISSFSLISHPISSHPSPPPLFSPLSLHDALPISLFIIAAQLSKTLLLVAAAVAFGTVRSLVYAAVAQGAVQNVVLLLDRKSTRLNSSHRCISYAVFCLKKKKIKILCIYE